MANGPAMTVATVTLAAALAAHLAVATSQWQHGDLRDGAAHYPFGWTISPATVQEAAPGVTSVGYAVSSSAGDWAMGRLFFACEPAVVILTIYGDSEEETSDLMQFEYGTVFWMIHQDICR